MKVRARASRYALSQRLARGEGYGVRVGVGRRSFGYFNNLLWSQIRRISTTDRIMIEL